MPGEFILIGLLGALLCIGLDIWLTLARKQREKRTVDRQPARVICSVCAAHLSGLESFCPRCQRRLSYHVASLQQEDPWSG